MELDRAVAEFLALKRIAVAGVSRSGKSPGNAIAQRLRETDHTVFAINRSGETIDGQPSYSTLDRIPGGVDGLVVVTNPREATALTEQAAAAGVKWIWYHQGFGPESFDAETLSTANRLGLKVIAAACPMMYLNPDVVHRCARTAFQWFGRIPRQIEISA